MPVLRYWNGSAWVEISGGGGVPAGGLSGQVLTKTGGADFATAWRGNVPLDQSTWSWVNQGGATVTQSQDVVYLDAPANAGANAMRIRVRTLPTAPFTVVGRFAYDFANATYFDAGLVLRESGTGKMELLGPLTDASVGLRVTTASSPTAYIANFFSRPVLPFPPYLRVAYDGTNITYSYSFDGVNFRTLGTRTKTTYFTTAPDQLGFYINIFNATHAGAVSVLSWLLT